MGLVHSVRQRSVGHVINELLYGSIKYDYKTVYFTDDVLTMNTEWLAEFSREYRKWIEVPFYCTANPGTITEQQIWYLKRAGCQMIGYGLQSTDERIRKELLHRTGTNERILRIAKTTRNMGIRFSFDHILDLPTPTEGMRETLEQALNFYEKARPDIINTFTMTYLPKIELNEMLPEEERCRINRGEVRTSMLKKSSDTFTSAFAILTTFGLRSRVRLPFWVRLILKDIKRLMIGRRSDATFPVRLLLSNIRDNLWIKYGVAYRSRYTSAA